MNNVYAIHREIVNWSKIPNANMDSVILPISSVHRTYEIISNTTKTHDKSNKLLSGMYSFCKFMRLRRFSHNNHKTKWPSDEKYKFNVIDTHAIRPERIAFTEQSIRRKYWENKKNKNYDAFFADTKDINVSVEYIAESPEQKKIIQIITKKINSEKLLQWRKNAYFWAYKYYMPVFC